VWWRDDLGNATCEAQLPMVQLAIHIVKSSLVLKLEANQNLPRVWQVQECIALQSGLLVRPLHRHVLW